MLSLTATVAVEKTYFNLESDYDYIVPEEMADKVAVGMRVLVPFGKAGAVRSGFIVALHDFDESIDIDKMKNILSLSDEKSFLTQELISLALWLKERTFCTTYDCLKAMLPRGLGLVRDATVKMARLNDGILESENKFTKKQQSVIDLLMDVGSANVKEVCTLAGVTESVVNTLNKNGAVTLYDSVYYRKPSKNKYVQSHDEIVLTDKQNEVYRKLSDSAASGEFSTALLFGVTGSGKTSVFLKVIDDVIADGKNVIVLVPEISLTPQTMSIFLRRYGDSVAVFHSALSLGERSDEFKRVKEGKVRIVIGTRSAIFAPLENIGLIVIDEEQEHTYKSENTPRYHARDVARYRCAYNKALLLLASATPSIESYSNALAGKYTLCRLDERYGNATLPKVEIADMRSAKSESNSAVSPMLADFLEENLKSGHQSILLINRRGFNTFIACNRCGHVITCPNCSISLTYHASNNRLMCHYCGYSEKLRNVCPECSSENVRYSGFGTQRVEEELAQRFPNARILRMDADTTAGRYSHETKLEQFSKGDYDILVGTQMVAKGLDFPNVTLVGVVNADNSLYDENYNASEKAFSLLTQVVGRSGRGEFEGRAVIQTINPDNPTIEFAANQDYCGFYETEIQLRRLLTYPPYCDILAVGFSGTNENTVAMCATSFFNDLVRVNTQYHEKVIVLGPSSAKIAKINNKYRYRLIIKCKNSARVRKMLHELLVENSKKKEFRNITVYVDLNPDDLS